MWTEPNASKGTTYVYPGCKIFFVSVCVSWLPSWVSLAIKLHVCPNSPEHVYPDETFIIPVKGYGWAKSLSKTLLSFFSICSHEECLSNRHSAGTKFREDTMINRSLSKAYICRAVNIDILQSGRLFLPTRKFLYHI